MTMLQIGLMFFAIVELLNILALYQDPTVKYGNSVGVFNSFKKAKEDTEMNNFVTYLINWVAGSKLVFILLAMVIAIWGDKTIQQFAIVALILSILSFYIRLYPLLKKMDENGEITPKGYYLQLSTMILIFVFGFTTILFLSIF